MNILILDHHKASLRELMREISDMFPDAECAGVESETDALRYTRNNNVDVAFLDVNAPDDDGIRAAEKMQKRNPNINVIIITVNPELAQEAFRLYASDFILKPVTRDDLKHAFDNLRHPVVTASDENISQHYAGAAVIGERIKRYREKNGMTAKMLAEKLDVTLRTVNRWERGDRVPDIARLTQISRILGISVNDLMNEDTSQGDVGNEEDGLYRLPPEILDMLAAGRTEELLERYGNSEQIHNRYRS